jgi:hypothetical protein
VKVERRLFVVAVLLPTLTSAIGIDAGAIFQIAALENLGLTPRALGIAFGLGIVSVPVQLWAAHMPLRRARANLRLYAALVAVMCAVMAVLVAVLHVGDRLAVLALVVTVVAEITLSVLYATSWQPLVSFTLTSEGRQRLNARGGAAAGGLKAAAALLVGAVAGRARAGFFALFAAVAVGLMVLLGRVPAPDHAEPDPSAGATQRTPIPDAMKPLYLTVGLVAAGAWPLFIVYVDNVLWPAINLGLVAAVQLTGSLLAAALWRSTAADVGARARWGSAASALAVVSLATLPAPVSSAAEQLVFFAALATAAAATTTVFLTLMELSHRVIDARTAVRSMTVYDVVASTSMQAGLLAGGFLVAASHGGRFDAYRVYLVAMAAAALAVVSRATSAPPGPVPPPAGRAESGAGSAPGPGAAAPPAPLPPEGG